LPNARKKQAAKRAPNGGPAVRLVRGGLADATLPLADGARAVVKGGTVLELRDAQDRLLVRYENGRAEIAAPAGDLVLSAPSGRVVLRAGTDVDIQAERDLRQKAGHRAEIQAERLHVKAEETRVVTGQVSLKAERIVTTARALVQNVERLEVSAARLFEKTRETYREAADLLQTRAGRVRAIVEDACSVQARRTTIVSKEETSIDGKKVLLG